jgi:hypothetical protein
MPNAEPGFFEFVEAAREFFDGPQTKPDGGSAGASDNVIDVEASTVEVVDSPTVGEAPPPSSAPSKSPGPGFTMHISPEYLLERLAWVIGSIDEMHREVVASKASEPFANAWRLWYRDILVWRKRIEATKGANATKADYDRLDAMLQRLSKWRERLARERHALEKDKGDGLPWYVWGGIIVGGFYAARNILGGFLTDLVS